MMEIQDWLLSYYCAGMPRSLRCGLATSEHFVERRVKRSKLYFYAPSCVLVGVARSVGQMAGKESSNPLATVSHHSLTGQKNISHCTFAFRSSMPISGRPDISSSSSRGSKDEIPVQQTVSASSTSTSDMPVSHQSQVSCDMLWRPEWA